VESRGFHEALGAGAVAGLPVGPREKAQLEGRAGRLQQALGCPRDASFLLPRTCSGSSRKL